MKKLSFILLLLQSNIAFCQNKEMIDSLTRALQTVQHDTVKAKILSDLSWEYHQLGDAKAYDYAKELLGLSNSVDYKWGIAAAYTNLAFYYENIGDYPEALKYRIKDVQLNEQFGTKKALASSYNNIANLYNYIQEFDKGLEFYFKKIEIVKKYKFDNIEKRLGSTYNNIGVTYKNKLMLDSSLKYVSIAKAYALKTNESSLLIECYLNTGMVLHQKKGNDKEALANFLTGFDIAQKTGTQRMYSVFYGCMADSYFRLGDSGKALENVNEAIHYALLTGQKTRRLEAYQTAAQVYDQLRDYKSKSEYIEKSMHLSDSLVNEEKNSLISTLRIQFETEEKEKENLVLASEVKLKELQLVNRQYLMLALGSLLFLAVIAAFLIIRQNRLKAKQQSIEMEQKLLRSQMNPHFIFNSLQAIQNFISEKEAIRYLSSFGALTRSVLENSRLESISLKKEIILITHYLELQSLLHEGEFSFMLKVPDDLETASIQIPPMLAQPFIENAIEHGMRVIKSGGLIEICFSEQDDFLIIEIKDNGKGLSGSKNEKHHSLATEITRERIALLNKKNKRKASFVVTDAFPGNENKGVKVVFSLPI